MKTYIYIDPIRGICGSAVPPPTFDTYEGGTKFTIKPEAERLKELKLWQASCIPFEDQKKTLELITGFTMKAVPFETNTILGPVEVPAYKEVRQYQFKAEFGLDNSEWFDWEDSSDKGIDNLNPEKINLRTICRFEEGEKPVWFLEHVNTREWLAESVSLGWTKDPQKAKRFATSQQAQEYDDHNSRNGNELYCYPTEHLFIKEGEKPTEEPKECECTGPWDCQCQNVKDAYYGNQKSAPSEDRDVEDKPEGKEIKMGTEAPAVVESMFINGEEWIRKSVTPPSTVRDTAFGEGTGKWDWKGEEEKIAQILRDNITFNGQIGDYVIHGAIQKIIEWANSRGTVREQQESQEELWKEMLLVSALPQECTTKQRIEQVMKHFTITRREA